MNIITGGFDVVIEVQETTVNRIFRAMHAGGALAHRIVQGAGQQRLELVLDAPHVTLTPGPAAVGPQQATAIARLRYQLRPLADAAAPGITGTADVSVRAALDLRAGSGGDSATPVIAYDWSATTRNDITVYGQSGADADQAAQAILAVLQATKGAVGVRLGDAVAGLSGLPALRFLSGAAGGLAALGANVLPASAGTQNQLAFPFAGSRDWAMALSRDYVLAILRDGMKARWSSLPPPNGTDPVLISDQVVCTLRIAGECLDSARRRVYLDSFDVSLGAGAVIFTGAARAVTDAWYMPEIHATFSFAARLSIDAAGQLAVTTDASTVDLSDWYADVFDFFSFGAIAQMVGTAFQKALMSPAAGEDISNLFSARVLNALASLGKAVQLAVAPRADTVLVLPDAIIIQGNVEVPELPRRPDAGFVVLRGATPGRRLLHGGACWAPGRALARLAWDFGDGATVQRAGTAERIVEEHDYAPGIYVATVTASDDAGHSFSYSERIAVGQMTLAADRWIFEHQQSPIPVDFTVTEAGVPLQGATVTVSVPGWQQQHSTGADGRAHFSIDPAKFTPIAAFADPSGWWVTAAMSVAASKAGYSTQTGTLYIADPQLQLTGDWLISSARAPFAARFRVLRADSALAVAGAIVTATGAAPLGQATSGADGYAELVLDPAKFVLYPQPAWSGNVLATGYAIIEASKDGMHAIQHQLKMGVAVPSLGSWAAARAQLDEWWKWPIELAREIERGRPVDDVVRDSLGDVMLSLDVMREVLALPDAGSQLLAVTDVLGIPGTETNHAEALEKQTTAIARTLGRNVAAAHKTITAALARKAPAREAPAAHRRTAPASERSRAVIAHEEQRAARVRALARAAKAIPALSPEKAGAAAGLEKAIALLGRLARLARQRSPALPLATLLGVAGEDAAAAVDRRIDELLALMRRRLADMLLDEDGAPS
jgi:hypothetical protein